MNKRKSVSVPGFLTLIMIFLVICLSMIGATALSSTAGGDRLVGRTAEYLDSYRSARNLSEIRLSQVDGCIAAAARTGLFDMNFEGMIEELDFVTCRAETDRYILSCYTPIDEVSSVYWEISVDKFPADGRGGYTVITRRTADSAGSGEDERLNVWQGW